jgi:diguanylate cyclase (GGDEF)-like protein
MRLTNRVFYDLAIWMVAFGLVIGLVFPFFVLLLGVPMETAITPGFFGACLGAGALAGCLNFTLAKLVVGNRVRLLADRMGTVGEELREMTYTGDLSKCTPENCSIVVDSDDEIGDSARAFNSLVKALASSMRTQAAVRSFTQMLSSRLELDAVSNGALRQLLDHTGAAAGAILVDIGGHLQVQASLGVREPETIVNRDLVRAAMQSDSTEILEVPRDVEIEGALVDFRPRAVVFLPVSHKSVPLGVVVMASTETFEAEDLARLDLFRHGLGLALNNAMAHSRLQRLAALDPLTGVYNRRFGLGRLHEEFGRAIRANTPLGVIMLDLDHFKSVNDTYGHQVGDRLLTSVAGIVSSMLREGDILVRYGGEEFLVVLPAASSENIRAIGERVRRAVEESSLVDGSQTVRITISVGGAAYPNQNVLGEESLLELADEALYVAKQAGRNRVEIANESSVVEERLIEA